MKRTWVMAVLLVALGAAAGAPLAGQAPPATRPSAGRELYLSYCASCHGLQGRGDGPAAPSLTVRPPDLTRLTSKMKGEFPSPYVRETIVAGRKAHGSPDMPTWGPIFQEVAGAREASVRVDLLMRYLEEMQVP